MTKQQIVVQLVAAKIINSRDVYDTDLINYGKLADKIIEMFPEPSTEIVYSGSEIGRKKVYEFSNATVVGNPLVVSVEGMKQTFSTSVHEDYNA